MEHKQPIKWKTLNTLVTVIKSFYYYSFQSLVDTSHLRHAEINA
jgi:hypothetical protein